MQYNCNFQTIIDILQENAHLVAKLQLLTGELLIKEEKLLIVDQV